MTDRMMREIEEILSKADLSEVQAQESLALGDMTVKAAGEHYMRIVLEMASRNGGVPDVYLEHIRKMLPEIGETLGEIMIKLVRRDTTGDTTTNVRYAALGFAMMMLLKSPESGTLTGLATAFIMGYRANE